MALRGLLLILSYQHQQKVMNMITLLERLKDEVRQKMEEEREEFTAAIDHIERELSKHEWVFDLPYGTAQYMRMYLNVESPYDAFEDKD